MNVAYNCDCMEYMKTLPDKYFDLAVVDPPYGIGEGGQKAITRGKQSDSGRSKSNAKSYAKEYHCFQDIAPSKAYFDELFRVSKNQIIWGGNHLIGNIQKSSPCWIVWDKENGETDFADCELAWTSFKTAVRIFRFKWHGMMQGDMKNRENRIHPTQKPVALYEWVLSKYAKPGDKIFDSHLGSGSSRIAAYNLGFDFVGCEIDKEYFDKQEERFAAIAAQTRLF